MGDTCMTLALALALARLHLQGHLHLDLHSVISTLPLDTSRAAFDLAIMPNPHAPVGLLEALHIKKLAHVSRITYEDVSDYLGFQIPWHAFVGPQRLERDFVQVV